MKNFLHISDVHLGYQQYGLRERFNDFGDAYFAAVDLAAEEKVDFVLISGDLFDKTKIDPMTLIQAVEGLKRLQKVGIKVIAISGNHDRTRYQDSTSWLDFLAEQQYLYLLTPSFEEDGIHLNSWDGSNGGYVDIDGVRIIGLPYLGASTETVVEEIPSLIFNQPAQGIRFTILMGHFGIDGKMPGVPGGLPSGMLSTLKGMVDYLALGHWHKPFEQDGWIYNPGSLECCGIEERNWRGGCFLVSIPENSGEVFSAKHIPMKRRLIYKIVFPVDGYNTPHELLNSLSIELLAENSKMGKHEKDPIVELSLEGILAFDRQKLDLESIRQMMDEILKPILLARPVNQYPIHPF